MQSITLKVWQFITAHSLLAPDDVVVLAVSGGADSTAMLHLLKTLNQRHWPAGRLYAVHLNHQLRGAEAEADAEFLRALCAEWSIPLTIEAVDVRAIARQQRSNLEATARQLRYDFLARVARQQGARRIMTAHTMNDQAESLLLRLVRGSGGAGLAAIAPLRPLKWETPDLWLARPLLGLTREEVIAYCAEQQLAYRTDSSNFALDYARNRVRHEILPQLRQLNPQIVATLAQTAERLRQDENYLQQVARNRLTEAMLNETQAARGAEHKATDQPEALSDEPLTGQVVQVAVSALIEAPSPIRQRMLREAIALSRGDLRRITARHLAAVESLLEPGKSGRRVELPGLQVAREFDLLRFSVEPATKPAADYLRSLDHDSEVTVELSDGVLIISLRSAEKYTWEERSRWVAVLDASRVRLPLWLRPRRPGDRYQPIGAPQPLKLKEVLIKNRIPARDRSRYPLVVTATGELVWGPGLPVAAQFAATPATENWLVLRAEVGRKNHRSGEARAAAEPGSQGAAKPLERRIN